MKGALSLPLLIRADATTRMGSGHIMRCLALATAARQAGMPVAIGGRCDIPWLLPRLKCEGYLLLDGGCPPREAPASMLWQMNYLSRHISQPLHDCIAILDGYHFTCDCQTAVRNAVRTLAIIDDYCHLSDYDCDILINPNPAADEYPYSDTINFKLLGLDYTLLRPEFLSLPPPSPQAHAILLSLGGGNFSELLTAMAPAFSIPSMAGKTLRILAGSMPPDTLRAAWTCGPYQLEILSRVDDMPALLAETEICVSAGGSTCWELCRMGVPFLTVEVAENQHRNCDWLNKHGYAPRFSVSAFTSLLTDASLRATRSALLRTLVDGRGVQRVIHHLQESLSV